LSGKILPENVTAFITGTAVTTGDFNSFLSSQASIYANADWDEALPEAEYEEILPDSVYHSLAPAGMTQYDVEGDVTFRDVWGQSETVNVTPFTIDNEPLLSCYKSNNNNWLWH